MKKLKNPKESEIESSVLNRVKQLYDRAFGTAQRRVELGDYLIKQLSRYPSIIEALTLEDYDAKELCLCVKLAEGAIDARFLDFSGDAGTCLKERILKFRISPKVQKSILARGLPTVDSSGNPVLIPVCDLTRAYVVRAIDKFGILRSQDEQAANLKESKLRNRSRKSLQPGLSGCMRFDKAFSMIQDYLRGLKSETERMEVVVWLMTWASETELKSGLRSRESMKESSALKTRKIYTSDETLKGSKAA